MRRLALAACHAVNGTQQFSADVLWLVRQEIPCQRFPLPDGWTDGHENGGYFAPSALYWPYVGYWIARRTMFKTLRLIIACAVVLTIIAFTALLTLALYAL